MTNYDKLSENKFIWIVQHSTGDWDNYALINLFITESEDVAKTYVNKFNEVLDKWKKHMDVTWRENSNYNFERWNTIENTNPSWYDKIEIR